GGGGAGGAGHVAGGVLPRFPGMRGWDQKPSAGAFVRSPPWEIPPPAPPLVPFGSAALFVIVTFLRSMKASVRMPPPLVPAVLPLNVVFLVKASVNDEQNGPFPRPAPSAALFAAIVLDRMVRLPQFSMP